MDSHARLLALFLLLPFVAGASLSQKPKYFPQNPKEVRKYGCSVQAHENDPYWHTYVWALLPGEEVNCTEALNQKQQTGKAIPESCYVEQLSMRDNRKKALSDCSDWMDSLRKEIVRESKEKTK